MITPNVIGFSPEPKVAGTNVQRMKTGALPVWTVDRPSEQAANEVVQQISDPELHVLSQLRLANLKLHLPMGESIVQMISSKSSWAEYQTEEDKN